MRFTLVASPGSDPGEARARATTFVEAADPEAVATAARASVDPFVLLLAAGARPLAGAFAGVNDAGERLGVLGGAVETPPLREFGWMLGPSAGPLPFDLVPVVAAPGEAGADASVRGPIDVVAPGMVLAARELLAEALPRDPVAAMLELCARARAAGREVVCRPSFACRAPAADADDRGRTAALRAVAERRPELRGAHRLPRAWRADAIDRQARMPGGLRTRVRLPMPALTVLVHGPGAELGARRARDLAPRTTARAVADAAHALRAELRVRGDRYVLVAESSAMPDRDAFLDLVETLESSSAVALTAPSASALDGSCVLIAPGRLPQHVVPAGGSLPEAIGTLIAGARAMRRAVRAPGFSPALAEAGPRQRTVTMILLASSLPEVLRVTLTAAVESTRTGDELLAVTAANAATARRLLAAYPQLRVVEDAVDPLLAGAVNRLAGSAPGDLVMLLADDVLLPPGTLDRLRAAFARMPSLGAALPAVPGAAGGEAASDVQYAELAELRALAERRAVERARDAEPIDVAVTPAILLAREALDAVGGIDPAHGPTRRGIADLVLRLRAAGYGVVRCDDALVHRFSAEVSHSPAAAVDARTPVPSADPAAIARGFDPARRVPFDPASGSAPAAAATVAVAVAVRDAAELDAAAAFLGAAAAAFDATAPVRIHLLLDGDVSPAEAAARVRPVLAARGIPLAETVAVRIERAPDLGAWLVGLEPGVRIVVAAGHDRDAFAGVRTVEAARLRGLLDAALR